VFCRANSKIGIDFRPIVTPTITLRQMFSARVLSARTLTSDSPEGEASMTNPAILRNDFRSSTKSAPRITELSSPALPPPSVRVAKRVLDVVGASLGILFALPVTPFIALAIRLNSPGHVLYRQKRLARHVTGRPQIFEIWKFRTMRVDAEADGNAVWAQENDPRITAVGAFLRRTRMDEIPQLFQVLRGEMSLIGPRPERPSISNSLSTQLPAYHDRLAPCKPGITGWAQIHTGYDTSVESVREKLLFDFAYNAHLYGLRSYLAMELRVVVGTLAVMVLGRGAR
jgi:lipopolysaccharide/colanic/teichoic acid biosynthesis glycosyltransferase